MDSSKAKQKLWNIAMAALLFSAILCLYSWSSSYSSHLLLAPTEILCDQSNLATRIHVDHAYKDELQGALAKASMRNKTVIIAVVNKAYADQDVKGDTTMLDLFLSSFWLGEGTRSLIDHVLIVAMDKTAYDRCIFLRLNCYMLKTEGVDFGGERLYMSRDFVKMMWRRTLFLLDVLKRGYNFIFTDTDVMWLRDPLLKLSKNESEDLQISTDHYLGNPWSNSKQHPINTGFYFVRSNKKTISLFETWYGRKDNSTGQKEQDVLQDLIRNGIIGQLGLKVRYLDTLHFSGFCEDSKDFRQVSTVHANCCRSISAKVKDLKAVLRDWKQFKRLEADSKVNLQWTKHNACWDSWTETNKTKA